MTDAELQDLYRMIKDIHHVLCGSKGSLDLKKRADAKILRLGQLTKPNIIAKKGHEREAVGR
jgi:hypothetical protein